MGDAAVVGAVVVVVVEVGVEVACEAAVADVQVPRERRAPALVEDRLVEPFDVAVRLRPSGVDSCVGDAEAVEGRVEGSFELAAVVAEYTFELPSARSEPTCDALGEAAGVRAGRLPFRA